MTDPNNPNLSAPSGSDLGEGVVEQLKDFPTLLMQARYALRDFDNKQPGCGFGKLAEGLNELAEIIERLLSLEALSTSSPALSVETGDD